MAEIAILIIGVLVLDGLVSAAEAALLSVPPGQVEAARAAHRRGAETLARLKEQVERPLGTLIVLSNIITIMGAFLVGLASHGRFGSIGAGIISGVLTLLVIVFAEIVPKVLGERYAASMALAAAPALAVVTELLSPVVGVANGIAALFTSGAPTKAASEEEITAMASMGARSGSIESDEATMIQKVFRLNDITARDLMTPRKRVVFVEGSQTLGALRDRILASKKTRLLVTAGSTLEEVLGVVNQRELLAALAQGREAEPVSTFAKTPLFVSGSMPADELIRELQRNQKQLGVVMNEHGEVSGVVTIKDCLEELVGEMIDERDVMPDLIKRAAKDEIVAHGDTKCRYVNSLFQTSLPETKTLNGFVQSQLHRIPDQGEVLVWRDLRFTVEEVDGGEITRLRVVRNSDVQASQQPHSIR